MAAAMEEDREADLAGRQQGRANAKVERRRWNEDQKHQMDELLPKATGRCTHIPDMVVSHYCWACLMQQASKGLNEACCPQSKHKE